MINISQCTYGHKQHRQQYMFIIKYLTVLLGIKLQKKFSLEKDQRQVILIFLVVLYTFIFPRRKDQNQILQERNDCSQDIMNNQNTTEYISLDTVKSSLAEMLHLMKIQLSRNQEKTRNMERSMKLPKLLKVLKKSELKKKTRYLKSMI